MRCCFRRLLLISTLAGFVGSASAGDPVLCSTEKVNDDCTLTIDRYYPVTLPTIQMRRGKVVTIEVANPLPFETLSLDLQNAQAIAGTDQTQGIVTGALGQAKGLVLTTAVRGGYEFRTQLNVEPAAEKKIVSLKTTMDDLLKKVDQFVENAISVYAELQEPLGTIPPQELLRRTRLPGSPLLHAKTPLPWVDVDYPKWRSWMLCELGGGRSDCLDNPNGPPSVRGLLAQATDLANTLATCSTQATTALDCQIKDIAKTDTSTYTSDQKTSLLDAIATLNAEYATLSADNAAIATITKDLNTYYVNIDQLNGQPSGLPSKTVTTPNFGNTATTTRIVTLGTISDPADAATKQFFIYKLLGRQVVFSANAVNQIGTFIASVPTAAQKKSIATITVLYADPILEASTGTFFSILPNRSFSNQTLVTQSAGGAPTLGNVVITQTISRPTIIPFVGANWRLGHDFLIGRRRGAFYLTAAIGLNPYNTTTEFGVGPSLSWRALMFSALYHEGHDVRLTQGEQLGEVWCNTSAANGSIPKCSGNPPAPSTEKFWTGTFAFGISVRVPSIFGSGSTGH